MLRVRQAAIAGLACMLLLLVPIVPAHASAGLAPSAPVSYTPVSFTPGACSELLKNGGFESQSANWTQEGAPGIELITRDNPRTGSYSAYLGGITSSDHKIKQQITLPAGQIITLKFWAYQDTLEHAPSMDDYLAVRLLNPNGSQLAEVASYGVDPELPLAYEPYTANLTAYAGKTVQLQFVVHNGQFDETWYFVDDVSVTSCTAKRVYLPLIRK